MTTDINAAADVARDYLRIRDELHAGGDVRSPDYPPGEQERMAVALVSAQKEIERLRALLPNETELAGLRAVHFNGGPYGRAAESYADRIVAALPCRTPAELHLTLEDPCRVHSRDRERELATRAAHAETERDAARAALERLHGHLARFRRFFRVDDGGAHWMVVAIDQDHCMEILRAQGATWETDSGREVKIDEAIAIDLVEIREYTPEEVAKRQRCHTEDERGVIPLAEARVGDAFCSEW